jgi:signal transduction histidine kinase
VHAIERGLERLTLTRQTLLAGGLSSALAALAALVWASDQARPWAGGLALGGLLATAAAAGLVHRAGRAAEATSSAARALARDDAPDDAELPFLTQSACWQDTSVALRRAVQALQGRIDALAARNAALGAQLQARSHQLSALAELSIGLAQQGDVSRLVDDALGALGQTMEYTSASVWARADLEPGRPVQLLGYRTQASDLAGVALSDLAGLRLSRSNLARYEQLEREPKAIIENQPRQGLLAWLWEMVTDDARTSALYRGTRSWMALPLKVRERVLGVLRVDHKEPDWFDPERARLLAAVAGQTALAMQHAQLLARERDLAVVAERNRIARDLHDAVSQTLFAANLLAGALARDEQLAPATRQQVQTLERLNRGALAEMRMLLFELRPDALFATPLAELLQHASAALSARGEVELDSHIDVLEPPAAQRVEVYRIAQEALSNVSRHSGARHVTLQWIVPEPGRGRLVVADDGHGYDPEEPKPGHFGLDNMRERATTLGAQLTLHGRPGEGSRVQLDLQWT